MINKTFLYQATDAISCLTKRSESSYCTFSFFLSIITVSFFPVFAIFGLVTNILTFFTFAIWTAKPTRQMIYLACLALANIFAVIVCGWLWLFPAKGLPYVTSGKIAYFTLSHGEAACRTHRYFLSFTPCLSCNLLTLAIADRTFVVYFPAKVKFNRKNAWILVLFTFILSAILMMPFGTETGYYTKGKYVICWLMYHSKLLQALHLLLTHCCLIQALSIVIMNVMLFVKLRKPLHAMRHKERRSSLKMMTRSMPVSNSVALLILSSMFLMSSVVQTLGYAMTYASLYSVKSIDKNILRYAWNVSDIGWQVFLLQASLGWIVYMTLVPHYRAIFISKIRRKRQKLSTIKYFSPRTSVVKENDVYYEHNEPSIEQPPSVKRPLQK